MDSVLNTDGGQFVAQPLTFRVAIAFLVCDCASGCSAGCAGGGAFTFLSCLDCPVGCCCGGWGGDWIAGAGGGALTSLTFRTFG
jgi:hypothetical protein